MLDYVRDWQCSFREGETLEDSLEQGLDLCFGDEDFDGTNGVDYLPLEVTQNGYTNGVDYLQNYITTLINEGKIKTNYMVVETLAKKYFELIGIDEYRFGYFHDWSKVQGRVCAMFVIWEWR